ncbi:hypothetical protein SANA_08390 [Gottschalkiaceae bacterium SANA]|nr:hypothetical protein SANA_08390 [Gottschalkiaceae bacterium SANA]
MNYKLVIIKNENREESATRMQQMLTDFGCYIKVRLGLHDVPADICSPSGLLVLEVVAEEAKIQELVDQLNGLSRVTAQMVII